MCKEFQRLKQEYERTLRVWAYYAFPVPGDVSNFPDDSLSLRMRQR